MSNELLAKHPMTEADLRSYLISLDWTVKGSVLVSPNGTTECLIHRTLRCSDGYTRVIYEFEAVGAEDAETLEEMEAYLPSWHEGEPEFGEMVSGFVL